MWMKGYNDGGEIYLPTTTNNDSFSGSRKLRPLIPRPPHAPPHHVPSPTTDPPNNHHHHHHHHHGRGVPSTDHFLALNHHLATTADQSKREFDMAQQVVVSSRWNPTPEQLRTLEDLWGRGTRTPSADEIQQITSRLRRYGKIEGKNVFYWFQNHKARERQKRRRQMESGGCPDEEHDGLNEHCETRSLGHKEAGGSSNTASEDVRRSNNDTPIHNNNWEGKLAGGRGGGAASAPASLSAAASASSSSVVTSLWMKNLNDNNSTSTRELLLNSPNTTIFSISGSCCCDDNDDNVNVNVPVEWRNATWHQLIATPPSSFSSSSCNPLLTTPLPTSAGHLIMKVTPETTASCSPSPASSYRLPSQEFQTLQLFPLRSCCDGEEDYLKGLGGRSDDRDNTGTGINEFTSNGHADHHQFYEFLPLKN